jgi:multidrug efflux pump subunit AcrB
VKDFIRFFASRHSLANVFTFLIIILGLSTLYVIQRDIFPKVDFDQMIVTTRYAGASPEDVELNVTNPIEKRLKEVEGIKKVISYSMENISTVHITIDPDTRDKERVKNAIRDAVARVSDLPPELNEKPIVKAATAANIFPIIEIGITGDVPYSELRSVARHLESDLLAISGVASLTKYGYLDREIKVETDADAIEKWQISPAQIAEAIRKRNIRATGGSFESFTSDKSIVTLAQFERPSDVEDVIVHTLDDGTFIRIRDLAIVREGFEPAKVLTRMNGNPGISFLVFKKEFADISRTVNSIRDLVAERRQHLPAGVNIDYSNDTSRLVKTRLSVVLTNGAMGLALVIVVLGLFMNKTTAFWVAMGIPVTLLGTLFLLPAFGAYLDSIALAAMILVIGIIVDDGIVIAESIWSRQEEGLPPLEAAVEGFSSVIAPVLTTITTTILAFAPLFFMPGMLGDFVYVIPLVIILALLISLADVVFALPAHLTRGATPIASSPTRKSSRFAVFREGFIRFIEAIMPWRYLVIALFVSALVGTFWYANRHMDFVLFPAEAADAFEIMVELPSGSSLEATSEKLRELENLVSTIPENELSSYVTRIGNHGELQLGENENWAYVAVYLTPISAGRRTANEITESLRQKAKEIVGISKLSFQVQSGGPPVGRPITLRVSGANDVQRSELTDLIVSRLEAVKGVTDVDRDDKKGKEQVKIDIDFIRLAETGLTVADVANNVRLAYDGEVVTSVRYDGEDVDFRVIMSEEARISPDSLLDLLIPPPNKQFIRLGEIATLEKWPGPSSIYHFNRERTTTITADVTKDITTPSKAIAMVMDSVDLKDDWPGMTVTIGGEAEETQSSMQGLLIAFLAAGIGIYLLLYLLFSSPLQPILVLSAIPFGLLGVIIAFALHHEPMGFLALLGVVGLSGIVVNDSLILVDLINKLKAEQPSDPWGAVIAEGTGLRLRPILLTTITTVSGLLPMAYGIGGSDPIMAPMALAMGYGLLFSTLLTLVLIPCLVMVGADLAAMSQFIKNLFKGQTGPR